MRTCNTSSSIHLTKSWKNLENWKIIKKVWLQIYLPRKAWDLAWTAILFWTQKRLHKLENFKTSYFQNRTCQTTFLSLFIQITMCPVNCLLSSDWQTLTCLAWLGYQMNILGQKNGQKIIKKALKNSVFKNRQNGQIGLIVSGLFLYFFFSFADGNSCYIVTIRIPDLFE